MGDHIDNRAPKRKKVREHDEGARHRRTSFKQYLRDLEEEILQQELEDDADLDDLDDLDDLK